MKRFFALAALVLGLASCQTEPEGLDIKLDGEVATTITVSIPETETRAGGNDSALGVFNNGILDGDATMRYILQVYYGETALDERLVKYSDGKEVDFDVRLVPNRDYKFVVWADVVDGKADVDKHYNTSDLKNITIIDSNNEWKAMDETRDAFTDVKVVTNFTGQSSINLELTRPFAKLRVKTTDMVEMDNIGVAPAYATVEYTTPYRAAFNAFEGHAVAAGSAKKHHNNFAIANYGDNVVTGDKQTKILFTDYFFAEEGDAVSFILNVYEDEAKTKLIKSNNFNTDIAVNRNYLTTIQGNILTDGNNIEVKVEDVFANAGSTDPNYEYETISSVAEFYAALNAEGQFIVISDLTIAEAGTTVNNGQVSTFSTRAGTTSEGKVTTINLNGKTITVTNKTGEPFATVEAGNTLVLEGGNIVLAEGSTASFIENKGNVVLTSGTLENESNSATAAVVKGKVIVEENATVNDGNTTKVEGATAWLADVLANGGTYVFTEDMKAGQIKVTATAPVVLDGNGYTFTYTGSDRAIEIPMEATGANVTIKNLNIVLNASNCERGINFNVTDGILTIDNVKVSETGTPATYAINLPGSSDNATVVINNSYLRGNIALNVWGKDMEITATNTEFVSYDDVEAENYAAISLNSDGTTNIADNTVVTINGGKIIALDENGEKSDAISNLTNTGTVTVSGSTEVIGILSDPVAIVTYAGYDQFYSCTTLQEAINQAAKNSNATVKLIKDITLDKPVMVAENQTIVLDLNGHNITTTWENEAAKKHYYALDNKGSLTIKDSKGNGKITARGIFNYGTMTLESGTIDACDGNGGYGVRNYAGAEFIMNGGSIVTSYEDGDEPTKGYDASPVRVDEGATATINGGAINNVSNYTVAIDNYGTTIINDGTFTTIHTTIANSALMTINGGSFTCNGLEGITAHALWAAAGTTTINGGTFDGKDNYNGFNVDADKGAIVNINGGKFLPVHSGSLYGEGTIIVKGGEFFDNPSARVAEGYEAIEENGKYVVVGE